MTTELKKYSCHLSLLEFAKLVLPSGFKVPTYQARVFRLLSRQPTRNPLPKVALADYVEVKPTPRKRYDNDKRRIVADENLKIRRKATNDDVIAMNSYYEQNVSLEDIATMFGYSIRSRSVVHNRIVNYRKSVGLPNRRYIKRGARKHG